MKKYVGIIHTWFAGNSNFSIFEIDAQSAQEAQTILEAKTFRSIDGFKNADGTLLILEEHQQIQRQSKLTWRERFTGRINHGRSV